MDEIEKVLCDLVAINSINPDLVPGAPGENEIAHYIAKWLEQAGLEVNLIESKPGRPNVVGTAHGTGGGKTLLLNGHMDTVGTGGMPNPHMPTVKDGRVYGRGAYDMKGGLTACMFAMLKIKKQHLRGDVVFTGVVDEEYASLGTQQLATQINANGAIVAEFTELQLILAHKGFVWLEVETQGKAAHGSRPDLGTDAIINMGKVLMQLEKLDQRLRSKPTHPFLGSGSVHASLIKGGKEMSTYPDQCVLAVERRTLPGESPREVEGELQGIIDELQRQEPSFQAIVRRGIERSPLETPEEAEIAMAVQTAAVDVLKRRFPIGGVPFWTDAAILAAAGIPSLLLGPSGGGAHADEEWVDLTSVRTCADVYLAAAVEFCK